MITCITDGSCRKNPGPGSIAYSFYLPKQLQQPEISVLMRSKYPMQHEKMLKTHSYQEFAVNIGWCTNNIAELEALHSAIKYLNTFYLENLELLFVTDSRYVIGLFESNHKAKTNKEVINAIKIELQKLQVPYKFQWTPGHQADSLNIRVDALAFMASAHPE